MHWHKCTHTHTHSVCMCVYIHVCVRINTYVETSPTVSIGLSREWLRSSNSLCLSVAIRSPHLPTPGFTFIAAAIATTTTTPVVVVAVVVVLVVVDTLLSLSVGYVIYIHTNTPTFYYRLLMVLNLSVWLTWPIHGSLHYPALFTNDQLRGQDLTGQLHGMSSSTIMSTV